MRITPENITHLEKYQIFVFGSNLSGIHGKGTANLAYKSFGAIWGQSFGLQGNSFGIPTKDKNVIDRLTLDEIEKWVQCFIHFAKDNQALMFLVTPIGCGYSRYSPSQIAPFFKECLDMENVYLPESFIKVLKQVKNVKLF